MEIGRKRASLLIAVLAFSGAVFAEAEPEPQASTKKEIAEYLWQEGDRLMNTAGHYSVTLLEGWVVSRDSIAEVIYLVAIGAPAQKAQIKIIVLSDDTYSSRRAIKNRMKKDKEYEGLAVTFLALRELMKEHKREWDESLGIINAHMMCNSAPADSGQVVGNSDIEVEGHFAKALSVKFDHEGDLHLLRRLCFDSKGRSYVLELICPQSEFERLVPLFSKFVDSFRMIP